MTGRYRPFGGHRGLMTAAATCVLALGGIGCIGFAVTHQERFPQPPLETQVPGPGESGGPAIAGSPIVGPILPASKPTTLTIPAIGVKSTLLSLGQAKDGTMDVPPKGTRYNDAGWYRYSVTPGALGPAIIAGHIDSAAKGPSVFFRLGGLRRHDLVSVGRADGSVAIFEVDEVHRYPKNHFPTQVVYGNTDHAALRLITCGGSFDHSSGHYLDNIVVYASLVRSIGVAPSAAPSATR